jgi:polyketide biosynthesis acyl carrier protein
MQTADAIVTIIRKSLCEVLPYLSEGEIDPARSTSDFGASSIDCAEIIIRSLEMLGTDVPFADFVDVANIRALARCLQERQVRG